MSCCATVILCVPPHGCSFLGSGFAKKREQVQRCPPLWLTCRHFFLCVVSGNDQGSLTWVAHTSLLSHTRSLASFERIFFWYCSVCHSQVQRTQDIALHFLCPSSMVVVYPYVSAWEFMQLRDTVDPDTQRLSLDFLRLIWTSPARLSLLCPRLILFWLLL